MNEQNPPKQAEHEVQELRPGDSISPRAIPSPVTSVEPTPAVAEPASPLAPSSTVDTTGQDTATQAGFYKSSVDDSAAMPTAQNPDSVNWTASEFVAHSKSASWYVGLTLALLTIAGLVFALTRDFVPSIVIAIVGIALGAYGSRQPRQLQYQLTRDGLTIADKFFPLNGFRSFSVVDEGAFSGIVFMPLKRFGQLLTIYLAPEDEERVVDLLSSQLPLEDRGNDPIDQLMRRIRF